VDFFSAQDNARKNTKWLVSLFALAVVSIIVLVYLAVIILIANVDTTPAPFQLWRPDLFFNIAAIISVVIILASLYKVLTLASGGGAAVAESLGGRLVSRATRDPLEQRLLNVVDEMAIASGLPVPEVYIMDHEPAINAFAAGYDVQHAVIAVTRGCLEQLKRDELQGVIAHEFSHVFNGDMRMNIRLMGVLHGILIVAIIGRMVLQGGSHGSSRNNGGIVVFGLALLLIGYIGLFFGRMIKAAVSRQREFLADAAAVQFTRNPAGLAGALKRIGGFGERVIAHPNAEEASHMFFDTGVAMHLDLLATHPPLDERIRRLEPGFTGITEQVSGSAASADEALAQLAAGEAISVRPDALRQSVGNSDERHLGYAHALLAGLPQDLLADVHDPQGARAVVYALLSVSLPSPSKQLPQLLQDEEAEIISLAAGYGEQVNGLSKSARLPLIELAIAALREVDGQHAASLLQNCEAIIEADDRVTVFEFAVLSLLQHALGMEEGAIGSRYGSGLAAVRHDCAVIFSVLARAGHDDERLVEAAYAAAWQTLSLEGQEALLPRSDISLAYFTESLTRLNTLKYRFKAQLIEACVSAIATDGLVTINEAELLRAIGARLDCPIPPLLPGRLAG